MNFESIVGFLTHPVLVTVLFAVASIFFAGFRQYRKAVKGLISIARTALDARSDKSPGGKVITDAEWTKIGKATVAFIETLPPLLRKGT